MNDQSPPVQHRSLKILGLASRSPQEEVARLLADRLEAAGIPHALGGALAYAY